MEEDTEVIINRFLEEAQQSSYPSDKLSIRDRYKDVSLLLHKKQQVDLRGSFLSFGSRRSSVLSSYGNTPTVIRRSLSSNGMIEYAVEQFGSLRWKGSRSLPTVTMEEKEAEELEEQLQITINKKVSCNETNDDKSKPLPSSYVTIKTPTIIVDPHEEGQATTVPNFNMEPNYNTEIQNRKSFSQYDIPPTRISSSKIHGCTSILETSFDTVSNTGSVIDLNGKIKQSNSLEEDSKNINSNSSAVVGSINFISSPNEQENPLILPEMLDHKILSDKSFKSMELDNSIMDSDNNSKTVRSSSYIDPEPFKPPFHDRANSVSERSSRYFKRTPVRSSLRDLPRRSPTPPRKSPRKVSKNCKEKGISKTEFCSLNINGTNYLAESLPLNKESNDNETLPPLLTQSTAGHHNKVVVLKNDFCPLPNIDLLVKLQPHKFETNHSSINMKEDFNHLANEGNIIKSSIVCTPYPNSIGLAPVSPNGKISPKFSSNSPPSFQRAFNRHRSNTQQQEASTTNSMDRKQADSMTPTYLYSKSKEASQVKLIRYIQSPEDQVIKSLPRSKISSHITKFIVTKSLIRSIPYDSDNLSEGDIKLGIRQSQNLITTNSSRLCSLM